MLERILYVSRVTPGVEMAELCRIIRSAHARNGAAGITGALLCLDGAFAQLLEGEAGEIGDAFERIAADPRHGGIEVRIRERGLCRLFPGQAMALRTATGLGAALLDEFAYRPGFPVEAFPAAVLTEFMVSACRQHRHQEAARKADRGVREGFREVSAGWRRGPLDMRWRLT